MLPGSPGLSYRVGSEPVVDAGVTCRRADARSNMVSWSASTKARSSAERLARPRLTSPGLRRALSRAARLRKVSSSEFTPGTVPQNRRNEGRDVPEFHAREEASAGRACSSRTMICYARRVRKRASVTIDGAVPKNRY